MSLTARDLLHKLAEDSGINYQSLARMVNRDIQNGQDFLTSVRKIARKKGLNPNNYDLDAKKIADEIDSILRDDYSQTLMISAVLAQMVESKGSNHYPVPAFFVYLEMLYSISEDDFTVKSDPPEDIDTTTSRMIELTTSLVSLICRWNADGIVGVSKSCPSELRDLAKTVYRKTRMLQNGLWTCISCGRIVMVNDTRALMCSECDSQLSDHPLERTYSGDRDRVGYGRTEHDESTE
ncbi:MAG: hypothetical protein BAJATHORv1_10077 [Candidatus Thorarchaeota archaeon]|nr:MAG: hypothetical protein BAJATHORv1_10077 [Candidatus Thorarchaeota archaeon]